MPLGEVAKEKELEARATMWKAIALLVKEITGFVTETREREKGKYDS